VARNNKLLIIIIAVFSLIICLLELSKGYTFEWDQADDAAKVFSIIQLQKPLLIGPRVANDNGFFIGPYHYYFLLPFYLLTRGDPLAGVYALLFVNVLTPIIYFLLAKKIFNQKIALLSALILPLCLGKICWNIMYAPLISITAFYICYQAINKRFSFPLAMLFAAFVANVHLVPASLTPIIILSFLLAKNKPKTKEIILGLLLFCLPFLPLIIFDLRHNFLNLNKLLQMLFGHSDQNTLTYGYIWLRSFWRSLNIIGLFPVLLERLFFLLILIIFPFFITGRKNKILVIVWLLLPLAALSQYKGTVSEYYYGMLTSLLPLFLAYLVFKSKRPILFIVPLVFLILFSILKISQLPRSLITLNDKKAVVDYLVNQKKDQPFNLSYETGLGFDFGFDYLFNYRGNPPKNVDNAHLYTLFLNSHYPPQSNIVFQKSIYLLVRR
jgi:hypothetical protein